MCRCCTFLYLSSLLFFFNDTATTEIYTLSLHDALPISTRPGSSRLRLLQHSSRAVRTQLPLQRRSEEHTSELQSHVNLVCRLLLEKKKKKTSTPASRTKDGPTTRRPPSALCRRQVRSNS